MCKMSIYDDVLTIVYNDNTLSCHISHLTKRILLVACLLAEENKNKTVNINDVVIAANMVDWTLVSTAYPQLAVECNHDKFEVTKSLPTHSVDCIADMVLVAALVKSHNLSVSASMKYIGAAHLLDSVVEL